MGYMKVAIMDADGQHEPSCTVELLKALDENCDLALGCRFYPGSSYKL